MIYQRQRIRLAADLSGSGYLIDSLTGSTPRIWRATDVQFELALLFGGQLLDTSNLGTLSLYVKPLSDRLGTPVMSATVGSGDLDNSLTAESWAALTAQHAVIPFTGAQTSLDLGTGSLEATYWLLIKATTLDSRTVVCGVTQLTVAESGLAGSSAAPLGNPSYYTAAEADAKYLPQGANWLPLYCPDDQKTYPTQIRLENGVPVITVGAPLA